MYSMTGYGRGSASDSGREITVELKSVNHRYLDVSMRLPRHLLFLEDSIRKQLSDLLSRGHIDVFINYRNTRTDAKTVCVNTELLKAYVLSAKECNSELGLPDNLGLAEVLSLPDVTQVIEADEDQEAVLALCSSAVSAAVSELKKMRLAEGERLKTDLQTKIDTVLELAGKAAERAPMVVEDYRKKLNERIEAILSTEEIDRARLATEVALFADHASIDEEIVRLYSHVKQMQLLFDADEPVGRKMDFVVQEMNREFNTMGSKANDTELTNLVLSGKAEIEKIREQIQNIE